MYRRPSCFFWNPLSCVVKRRTYSVLLLATVICHLWTWVCVQGTDLLNHPHKTLPFLTPSPSFSLGRCTFNSTECLLRHPCFCNSSIPSAGLLASLSPSFHAPFKKPCLTHPGFRVPHTLKHEKSTLAPSKLCKDLVNFCVVLQYHGLRALDVL